MHEENNAREAINTRLPNRLLNIANRPKALLDQELDEHNQQVDKLCSYANRVGRGFNKDKFWIVPEILRNIKPETKEDILRVKRELLSGKLADMEKEVSRKPSDNDRQQQLPAQYGRSQRVEVTTDSVFDAAATSDNEDDSDPSDDEDIAALARAMNTNTFPQQNAFMVRTSVLDDEPTVRAHAEYYGTMACKHLADVGNTIVISDSGGNTTSLDDSWLIMTSLKACRFANLVGYDPGLGIKRGLPFVDAVAKATSNSGHQVLIGIYEGVYNSGSPRTFISEYQVRNSGIILDSVAKNHRLTHDRLYGTQSVYHDEDNPADRIEFTLLNGLMTFKVSKPSMDDIRSMPIHWLTANNKWQPGSYNDNEPKFSSMYASKARQNIAERGGVWPMSLLKHVKVT